MRVLVCGGRNYGRTDLQGLTPVDCLAQVCKAIFLVFTLDTIGITKVIEGGALGADRAARVWAINRVVPFVTIKADWKRYGPAAGPIRNAQMLDEGRPDLVVAFPGGSGTKNMIKQARTSGIEVRGAGI